MIEVLLFFSFFAASGFPSDLFGTFGQDFDLYSDHLFSVLSTLDRDTAIQTLMSPDLGHSVETSIPRHRSLFKQPGISLQ
jgi:hypothetical protein